MRRGLSLAGGGGAGSVGSVAGVGWAGVDVGGAFWLAQAVAPAPASAMVSAKNRSRSMDMVHGLARPTAAVVAVLRAVASLEDKDPLELHVSPEPEPPSG